MRSLSLLGLKFNPFRLPLARYTTLSIPEEWKNKKLPQQTRRHPDLLLHMYLINNVKINSEAWGKIRTELVTSKKLSITPVNMDAIIIDTCCALANHDVALEYCEYMKANNHKFNLATLGKYFKLMVREDKSMTQSQEEELLKHYDELRQNYPIIDSTTAENCIIGLSATHRWRESIDLVKMIEEIEAPGNRAVSALICAAFRNNEPQIAWQFMKKISNSILDKIVYKYYIDYYVKTAKNKEEFDAAIGKLFQAHAEWDRYPWLESMLDFTNGMAKYGWDGKMTQIGQNGICHHCGHQLSSLQMSTKDFNYLKKAIFSKALVSENIYYKTTPKELTKFNRFINAVKPFDIVIDGLNIEYCLSSSKNKARTGGKLAHLIQLLLKKNKKIVVLGRKHMTNWSKTHMEFIQKNTFLFMANNLSQDDPYLLYATLYGGPDTYFVSNDLMRQHKFILEDPHLQKTFKLWQMSRQIQVHTYGTLQQGAVGLHYPSVHAPIAQKDDKGWHVPCMQDDIMHQPMTYDCSTPWYCFRDNVTTQS